MSALLVVLLIAILAVVLIMVLKNRNSAAKNPNQKALEASRLKNSGTMTQIKKQIEGTRPKAFKKEMRMLSSQEERMENKMDSLDRALKDYFGDSVISYNKFAGTIEGVQQVYSENTQKILKRIDVFDEEGYNDIFRRHQEYTDAIKLYQQHFDYVKERLDENEQILARLDKLLLEVNNLNDTKTPIDQLPAMQEISELIDQTKLYRQN